MGYGGRPTLYEDDMGGRVVEMGKLGHSLVQMASGLGVSYSCFDKWVRERPDFAEAVDLAMTHAQAFMEAIGLKATQNAEGFSASTYQFLMKNRYRRDYGQTQRVELTGADGGAIQTKQTIDVSSLSLEELDVLQRALGLGDDGDDGEDDQED